MTKRTTITKIKRKEQLRGGYYLMFALLGSFFIACLFDGGFAIKRADAAYTIDVPYQQAVPDLMKEVAEAAESVKNAEELEDVAQWEESVRGGLPEFLEDLITITQQLEESGNEGFIAEEYKAFADKWGDISKSYPGLSELEPILGPIIEQLLSGLPTLGPTPSGNPIGNLHELYVELTDLNPWFVGFIWDVPVVESAQKQSGVFERTQEITIRGYKSIDILKREILVQLNGVVVFSELIKDGALIDRATLLKGPSVLHEALEQMIEDGGASREIAVVQEFVDLINLNFKFALQNGIIDDCSYSLIFQKQLNGTKKTCTDINGNKQDFIEMVKYNPFDHVNQVKLTRVDPLTNLKFPATSGPSISSIDSFIDPAFVGTPSLLTGSPVLNVTNASTALAVPVATLNPSAIIPDVPIAPISSPMKAVLFGLLTPTYLWSAAGFMRLF